jgi:hypothetical protein
MTPLGRLVLAFWSLHFSIAKMGLGGGTYDHASEGPLPLNAARLLATMFPSEVAFFDRSLPPPGTAGSVGTHRNKRTEGAKPHEPGAG